MIRLYTDEQLAKLTGSKITPEQFLQSKPSQVSQPISTGKIRLYSDEQINQFQKVDKYNKLVEESWKLSEETEKQIKEKTSLKSILKGTIGLGEPGLGAVGKIAKGIFDYGKAAITKPKETAEQTVEALKEIKRRVSPKGEGFPEQGQTLKTDF